MIQFHQEDSGDSKPRVRASFYDTRIGPRLLQKLRTFGTL
jgi:hypothetical protein